MFPLFHIFVPLFFITLWIKRDLKNKNYMYTLWGTVICGALFPDLVDKPLSFFFPNTYSGRGLMHSPFMSILIIGAVFCLLRRKKTIPIAFSFGLISHLLLDLPNIPIFWPLVPIEIYHGTIKGWMETLLTNPLVLSTEIIGLVGISILFLLSVKRK